MIKSQAKTTIYISFTFTIDPLKIIFSIDSMWWKIHGGSTFIRFSATAFWKQCNKIDFFSKLKYTNKY